MNANEVYELFENYSAMFNPNMGEDEIKPRVAEPIMVTTLHLESMGQTADAIFHAICLTVYANFRNISRLDYIQAVRVYDAMDIAINGSKTKAPTKTLADYMTTAKKKTTAIALDAIKVRIWNEVNGDNDEDALAKLGAEYSKAFLEHAVATNSQRTPVLKRLGGGASAVQYALSIGRGEVSYAEFYERMAPHKMAMVIELMAYLNMNGRKYFKDGAHPMIETEDGDLIENRGFDMSKTCAQRLAELGTPAWGLIFVALADYAREGVIYLGKTDMTNMYRRVFNYNATTGTPWKGGNRADLADSLAIIDRASTGYPAKKYDLGAFDRFRTLDALALAILDIFAQATA